MFLGEPELWVSAEEFVNGAAGAGQFGVVIIVNDDGSLFCEFRENKLEGSFDGAIKVAVEEGEGDFFWQVLGGVEVGEECFFDDGHGEAGALEFCNDFMFRNEKFAGAELVSGDGGIFGGFGGEASEGIVKPELLGRAMSF